MKTLKLGPSHYVPVERVSGIFPYDSSTRLHMLRLAAVERRRVYDCTGGRKPLSVVIINDDGEQTVMLCANTPRTLSKRMNEDSDVEDIIFNKCLTYLARC